jgi:hypothetical protein
VDLDGEADRGGAARAEDEGRAVAAAREILAEAQALRQGIEP